MQKNIALLERAPQRSFLSGFKCGQYFFTFGGLTAALFQVKTVLTFVYVVVQFYPWFKPYFPLFQAPFHTQKQRKKKFKSRIKLNHNIYINTGMTCMVYMLN